MGLLPPIVASIEVPSDMMKEREWWGSGAEPPGKFSVQFHILNSSTYTFLN